MNGIKKIFTGLKSEGIRASTATSRRLLEEAGNVTTTLSSEPETPREEVEKIETEKLEHPYPADDRQQQHADELTEEELLIVQTAWEIQEVVTEWKLG